MDNNFVDGVTMRIGDTTHQSNMAGILLLMSGLLFVLAAVVYNEFLIAFLDPTPPLLRPTIERIRFVQIGFLAFAFIFIGLSELVRRVSRLAVLMQKTLVTNLLLSALVLLVPVSLAELALKPFTLQTSIFVEDPELGWRLKPHAEDAWGGVMVKINGKGLRGPELDYEKSPNVRRILYLGDSVTFGFRLKSHDQTFAYRTEAVLEERAGYQIETINAGVGGYSPWQEYIYFAREGIKYDPDLVVVSLVLNDIPEPLGLIQYGGTHRGYQLERTVASSYDWFVRKSSIAYFVRKIGARIRFGRDMQRGAEQEEMLSVRSLIYQRNRPEIQYAWTLTLDNLGKIFRFAKEKKIPLIFVIFPYTFQFQDIQTLATPQNTLIQYAKNQKVPVIDFLPLFYKKAKEQGIEPKNYFLDDNHLSPLGTQVVAETITDIIQREGFLTHQP